MRSLSNFFIPHLYFAAPAQSIRHTAQAPFPFSTRVVLRHPSSLSSRSFSSSSIFKMTDPSKYKLNHTMIRVKDPQESLKFYKYLGLSLIDTLQPDPSFKLYFLAYNDPTHSLDKSNERTDRQGVLELTHNTGTESDPNYKIHNGNTEPKGFGHIAISVDNIQAACKRLEDAGYKFQKKLEDGNMKQIAFALDPDGYWVEIIGQRPVAETTDFKTTDVSTYRFNHTMIRVKDINASLEFYQNKCGMKLVRTLEYPESEFNLYFLAFKGLTEEDKMQTLNKENPLSKLEGLLELTYNYGTEKKGADFKYHNGNDEPQGFGHICFSVDDLEKACERFEKEGVTFKKKLTDGKMKNIAFILDPDGYSIEIIQNEALKKKDS